MNTTQAIRILAVASCLCLLPSCKLIGSVAKIPVGMVKSVGRTVGLNHLTDHPARPFERKNTDRKLDDMHEQTAE